MNTLKKSFRLLGVMLVFVVAALIASCSEEDTLNSTDQLTVSAEASTDSYFEEAEDISSSVSFSADADLGGRSAGSIKDRDNRLACATITIKKHNEANPDTIVIDFGSEGCADNRGNVRRGKIIITYSGQRASLDSEINTTFEEYYVNGVNLEGKRRVTVYAIDNTSITHKIELTEGRISWADNTTATRTATHYRRWDHNGTLLNLADDQIILLSGSTTPGTAAGLTRNGEEYTMEITSDIIFKASCLLSKKYMPVSGSKVILISGNTGREITVDYGTGDCDNSISVTINGKTKMVTVSRS
jgi:hypothetical protein